MFNVYPSTRPVVLCRTGRTRLAVAVAQHSQGVGTPDQRIVAGPFVADGRGRTRRAATSRTVADSLRPSPRRLPGNSRGSEVSTGANFVHECMDGRGGFSCAAGGRPGVCRPRGDAITARAPPSVSHLNPTPKKGGPRNRAPPSPMSQLIPASPLPPRRPLTVAHVAFPQEDGPGLLGTQLHVDEARPALLAGPRPVPAASITFVVAHLVGVLPQPEFESIRHVAAFSVNKDVCLEYHNYRGHEKMPTSNPERGTPNGGQGVITQ